MPKPNLGCIANRVLELLKTAFAPHQKEDAFRSLWMQVTVSDPNLFWIEPGRSVKDYIGGYGYTMAREDRPRLKVEKGQSKGNPDVRIGHGPIDNGVALSNRKDAQIVSKVAADAYLTGEVKAGMKCSASDTNLLGGKETGYRADVDRIAKGEADFCCLVMDRGTLNTLHNSTSGTKNSTNTPFKMLPNSATTDPQRVRWNLPKQSRADLLCWCFLVERTSPNHSSRESAASGGDASKSAGDATTFGGDLYVWLLYKESHPDAGEWTKSLRNVTGSLESVPTFGRDEVSSSPAAPRAPSTGCSSSSTS